MPNNSCWYRTGFVSVAIDDTCVWGHETHWDSAFNPASPQKGDVFTTDGKNLYEIKSITNEKIVLDRPYQGLSAARIEYMVIRMASYSTQTEILSQVTYLFNLQKNTVNELGHWATVEADKAPITDPTGVVHQVVTPHKMNQLGSDVINIEELVERAEAAAATTTANEVLTEADRAEVETNTSLVSGYKDSALESKNLAEKWAQNPKDTPITTTEAGALEVLGYSAKHYAETAKATSDALDLDYHKVEQWALETKGYHGDVETWKDEVSVDRTAVDTAKTAVDAAKSDVETWKNQVSNDADTVAADKAIVAADKGIVATDKATVASDKAHIDSVKTQVDLAAAGVESDRQDCIDASTYCATAKSTVETLEAQVQSNADTVETTKTSIDTISTNITTQHTEVTSMWGDVKIWQAQVDTDKTSTDNYKQSALESKNAAETAQLAAEAAQIAAENAANVMAGGLIENGSVDLSSGELPTPVTDSSGNKLSTFWKVVVAGTAGGVTYAVGDTLVYSKSLDDYYKIDSTDTVTSVAGKTGNVTLAKSDVGLGKVNNWEATSVTNSTSNQKYATAAAVNSVRVMFDDYYTAATCDTTFLGINAKAANSALLEGFNAASFSKSTHTHTAADIGALTKASADQYYLGMYAKADNSGKLDGKTRSEVVAEARTGLASDTTLNNHIADTNNPHSVSATTVGLQNVKNYGISDSYALDSSTSYASSKAVNDLATLVETTYKAVDFGEF